MTNRTVIPTPASRIPSIEYGDLLNGLLVMGSSLGFCLLFWILVIRLFTMF
ncbi:MAG: hypothetical protein AAF564_08905 [Bacteroidota bacterium]